MKRLVIIAWCWVAFFVLLFLFYFVSDFYVVVGSGPRSWKKSAPLSPAERFVLSFIGATAITLALTVIVTIGYYVHRAALWLWKARRA